MKLKFKMRKKAILLPETLKIILSAACIVFLIYLIVSLYGLYSSKTEIEQARATLDEITSRAEALIPNTNTNVIVISPRDWYILTFIRDISENMPKKCIAKCICICEDNDVDSCDKSGLCTDVGNLNNLAQEIEIDKSFDLNVSKSSKETGSIISIERVKEKNNE